MMEKKQHTYVLITPAKNEEKYLPKVADSVIKQTIPPALWIIIDDGSTDQTPEIIKRLEADNKWISSITLPPHPRDLTLHISYVYKCGFDCLLHYCNDKGIDFSYIGSLDADTVLEATYFENLMSKFDDSPNLGIASGYIHDTDSVKFEWGSIRKNQLDLQLPRGSGRLWREKCFSHCGGWPLEPSADTITGVKAVLRGWEIKQFESIHAVQFRKTSSATGLWNGYRRNGHIAHYFNKHPLIVIAHFLYILKNNPYYPGIAYFWGYLSALCLRKKQIDDIEIRNYFWNTRKKEIISRTKEILRRYPTKIWKGLIK